MGSQRPPTDEQLRQIVVAYTRARMNSDGTNLKTANCRESERLFDEVINCETVLLHAGKLLINQEQQEHEVTK